VSAVVGRLPNVVVATAIREPARARHRLAHAVEPVAGCATLAETGISKYEANIFYGIVAPAKTPPDTIGTSVGWFSASSSRQT